MLYLVDWKLLHVFACNICARTNINIYARTNINIYARTYIWLAEKLTFALPSMSQSFASILAVSEDRGGQDASRFDKPRRGGGSRVSWKYHYEDGDDDGDEGENEGADESEDEGDDGGDLFHGG